MGLLSKGRSGRGSTKPANVKIRPALAPEDRAQPRRRADADSFAVIPRQEAQESDGHDSEGEYEAKFADEKKPLQGMQVCTTGKLELSREEIRRICHTLGARFEPALATNTTFLVSDRTEGDKYRAAVDNGIPVLHSAFLKDLHSKWMDAVPDIDVRRISEHHRLAPLHGLTICLTGYDTARSDLREKISLLGGAAYSPTLNHDATHLVIGPLFSSYSHDLQANGKLQAAQQINARRRAQQKSSTTTEGETTVNAIQIVWGEWLEHSLLAFGRLSEERYSCELVQDRSTLVQAKLKRTMDIVERAYVSPVKQRLKQKGKRSAGMLLRESTSVIMNAKAGQAEDSDSHSRKRAKLEKQESASNLEVLIEDSRIYQDVDDADTTMEYDSPKEDEEGDQPEMAVINKKRASSAQPGPSNLGVNATRPVLKKQRSAANAELLGVQDLLAPPSNSISSVVNLATQGNGTSSSSSSSSAVDVKGKGRARPVVVEVPTSSKAATKVKKEPSPGHSQLPPPVALPEASSLDTDRKPTSSSLLANLSKSRTSKFTSAATAANNNALPGIPRAKLESQEVPLPPAGHDDTGAQMLDPTHQDDDDPMSSAPEPVPIFQGKTVLLCLPRVASTLVGAIEDALRTSGAEIASKDGPEVDFLVYRFAQTGKQEIDIQDERIVTDVWLEACFFHERIVEKGEDELIDAMTKPLQFSLPLIDSENYYLSYAGFDECSMPLCIKFCNALGLRHDKKILRNKTTHLIIPNGEYSSTRLGAAQEWGVKLVYPEWLRGLAEESGRRRMEMVKAEEREQDGIVQVKQQVNGPLSRCRIAVHRDLQSAHIRDLITSLGATYSHSFDSHSSSTHFIFQSKRLKDPSRDFRTAQEAGKHIVHPKWLEACLKHGERLPEVAYKWTMDASRSLEIGLDSQKGDSRKGSRESSNVSTTGQRGREEEQENDEFALPPPLSKSAKAGNAVFPPSNVSGMAQSTPRYSRPMQAPASPPRSPPQQSNRLNRSSSATLCSPARPTPTLYGSNSNSKLRAALSEPNLEKEKMHSAGEDFGFVSSSTSKPGSGSLLAGSALAKTASTSSPTSSASRPSTSTAKAVWDAGDVTLGAGSSSDPDHAPAPVNATTKALPTSTAITRDLLAEMEAIMEQEVPGHLNARLPYNQQITAGSGGSGGGRAFRRMPIKKPGTSYPSSTSPQPLKVSNLVPAEPRYEALFESQCTRNETQTQGRNGGAGGEESMMVIRISDPTAEATKARMLAGIRGLKTDEAGKIEELQQQEEDDETQKSSESVGRRASKRFRAWQSQSHKS